ncbi:DnaB-like helicase N-terminal domain-containing protein [Faucicola atlantae]|uniref:DNA helicase DnaB-like N-terminal domain-containing protein n=1 Tax=Faucicola atlantae TaxID=34059 RepID=A0A1B8QK77_9GAMM|nr:DnaB-like helicase N-terminal domain-containing protein [Moraxella atlantae]OBX83873.1 hypothetical protein A9306_04355 [Moraxella atlantae]
MLYNIDIEKSVLASLMSIDDLLVISDVSLVAEDFYSNRHQIIYHAIQSLHSQNQPYDSLFVADYLTDHNQLDAAGGVEYLTDILTNSPATSFDFVSYVNRLRSLYVRRQAQKILKNGLDSLINADISTDSALDITTQSIVTLQNRNSQNQKITYAADFMPEIVAEIQARRENNIKPYLQTSFI